MPVLQKIIRETKKIIWTVFLCCFLFFISFTQVNSPSGTIKGIIIDSINRTPLKFATIELQEVANGVTLKTTLSKENGSFELSSPLAENCKLVFTHVGYKTRTMQRFVYPSSFTNLDTINLILDAPLLNVVQVATQKLLIEQDPDKLVYHADADPDNKTLSVLDLLRKLPLVYIDADDNLQLNGNSNYRVLINGKNSSLFLNNQNELFRTLPGTAIKTIEIITVPPSRYEAQGVGGIINITTYKKSLSGYNGNVSIRGSQPYNLSLNSNLTANLGKVGFNSSIGSQKNMSPASSSIFSREDKLQHTRLEQTGSGNSNSQSQNASGEISYQLNNQNVITAGYGKNTGSGASEFIQQVALFNAAREPAEAYRHLNLGKSTQQGQDVSLDFQHSAKRNEAQLLTLSYKRSSTADGSTSGFTLQPVPPYKVQQSLAQNVGRSKEQALKADFVQPVKKHSLELGASAVYRDNHSRFFYQNKDTATGDFLPDTVQSNQFDYRETIYGVYASFNLKMEKWTVKAGGRLEQAKINARFVSSGTIAIQAYSNLIPTFTLSRQLKEAGRVSLSYTQRIDRPSLYYLNPYVDRTDPWNISYGNPGLRPAVAHVFNLSYSLFKKLSSLTTTLSHYFINNAIQQITTLGSDTVARTTFSNTGSSRNYSLSLGFNTTLFNRLNLNLNGSTNSVKYVTSMSGKPFIAKGLTCQVSGSANLRLKNWRVGSTVSYSAPNLFLQGRTASYFSNSVMLNKYFFKNNRASIGLSVTSPFRAYRRSFTEINSFTFQQLRESHTLVRRFTVSLSYRFSKVQDNN